MKKFLSILLILTLLSLGGGSALAQEPTAEATAEPTQEATAEPTQEPTAEPTAEPTDQPTTEPTDQPTTEPTTEPTAEPTAEPTDQATAEPTTEPTVEPTVTITPTVEITATPTIAAEVSAGEISAAAVPGTWTSQYIVIQNLGAATANASLALFKNSATASQTIAKSIPVNGSVSVASSEISSNGQFAGVISSNELLAAGVINTNSTGQLGDSYAGFSTPEHVQTIPLVFRGHSNFKTIFYIQNAETSQQTVTIRTIKQGTSSPLPAAGVTKTIPGNSSIAVDFSGSEFNAFGSGSGAFGYATITGAGASSKVAALAENILDVSGKYQEAIVPGLNSNAAGTSLVAPLLYNAHASFNSGINLVNLTGTATQVTLTYTADASAYPAVGTKTTTVSLPGNGMISINMAALKASGIIPQSFGGAILSTNPAVNILAVVNSNKTKNGSFNFAAPAVNPSLATTKSAAPVALQLGSGGAFNSGITLFSPSGATSVTTKWVIANTNPPETYTITKSIVNKVANFNAAQLRSAGQLPNKTFIGSVFVTVSGGSGTPTGIIVVNNDNVSGGLSAQMLGVNY